MTGLAERLRRNQAWACGRTLSAHGWIYGVEDGLLRDLGCTRERTRQ